MGADPSHVQAKLPQNVTPPNTATLLSLPCPAGFLCCLFYFIDFCFLLLCSFCIACNWFSSPGLGFASRLFPPGFLFPTFWFCLFYDSILSVLLLYQLSLFASLFFSGWPRVCLLPLTRYLK